MLFCVSGEAGMDGWLWMVLDDVPIWGAYILS